MLRSTKFCGLAASVPLIGFVVPLVRARFDKVSCGPKTRLFSEPNETGSYCARKAVCTVLQSNRLLTSTELDRVVTPGIAEGSNPLRLKSNVVFSTWFNIWVGSPKVSRPRSIVLLFVQKPVGRS